MTLGETGKFALNTAEYGPKCFEIMRENVETFFTVLLVPAFHICFSPSFFDDVSIMIFRLCGFLDCTAHVPGSVSSSMENLASLLLFDAIQNVLSIIVNGIFDVGPDQIPSHCLFELLYCTLLFSQSLVNPSFKHDISNLEFNEVSSLFLKLSLPPNIS